ncbi:hypothetical protein ACFXPW_30795 [Streptomyces goshikiensis]|uniref:hypothetical protein n=1 Tax=Streptomyces goshikiensis TaxID=1942 RepID=UPI0036B3963B
MRETVAGAAFPASFTDTDALLVGTGRQAPTGAERAALGALAERLPFVIGRPPRDRRAVATPLRRCRAVATPRRVRRWPAGGG